MSSNKIPDELIHRLVAAVPGFQRATADFDRVASTVTGLHPTDLRCLEELQSGPITAGELATAAGLTRGATTALIDRLVTAGFAERRPDPSDRRSVRIALTPLAEAWIEAIWGPMVAEGAVSLSTATEAEVTAVVQFLENAIAIQRRHAVRIATLTGVEVGKRKG